MVACNSSIWVLLICIFRAESLRPRAAPSPVRARDNLTAPYTRSWGMAATSHPERCWAFLFSLGTRAFTTEKLY